MHDAPRHHNYLKHNIRAIMDEEFGLNILDLIAHISTMAFEVNASIPDSIRSETDTLFRSIEQSLDKLERGVKSDRKADITNYGMKLASDISKLANIAAGLTRSVPPNMTARLLASSSDLKSLIELHAESARNDNVLLEPESKTAFLRTVEDKLKSLYEGQERHDQRTKKLLNENELRIAALEKELVGLGERTAVEMNNFTAAYASHLHDIKEKKTEIDGILGHVSGRAVAGDYEKSAAEERKMADWLRTGSLVCMGAIAIVLGYSFIETIDTDFNWQKSLFRIALAFLLSVPAAYLARESAKHREQQYQHLQTSLDLKAISPFMASLPEDEQHKIKIAIASKIFAGRDFSKVGADPYPLNTHEIIIELIKRFDPAKANSKPSNDAAEPK